MSGDRCKAILSVHLHFEALRYGHASQPHGMHNADRRAEDVVYNFYRETIHSIRSRSNTRRGLLDSARVFLSCIIPFFHPALVPGLAC